MKKRNILLIILLCVLLITLGGTLAYFNSRHVNETTLTSKVYSTRSTQTYTSPDNFLPGTLVNMNTKVTNTGEVEVAVRAKIEESWTSHNNASLPLYQTKSNKYYRTILFNTNSSQECLTTSCATDITSINADWTYSNGYYYYKYYLGEDDETTSLISSLLFNSYIENDISCSTNELTGDNVCSSTGNGYDNATYNLRLTFETVQSDIYQTYWNTNVSITTFVLETVEVGDPVYPLGADTFTYSYVPGMTWGEWVESPYNNDEIPFVVYDGIIVREGYESYSIQEKSDTNNSSSNQGPTPVPAPMGGTPVSSNDIIDNTKEYEVWVD